MTVHSDAWHLMHSHAWACGEQGPNSKAVDISVFQPKKNNVHSINNKEDGHNGHHVYAA